MFLHVASAMRIDRYIREGPRAFHEERDAGPIAAAGRTCGSGDHFFGAAVPVVDGAAVLVEAGAVPVDDGVADVSEVDGVDGVEVVFVDDGSVAGLLSLPPHAIARAASAERTMSFFMI